MHVFEVLASQWRAVAATNSLHRHYIIPAHRLSIILSPEFIWHLEPP